MRFIDEAQIKVRSGNGGRGCVSFRHEKYIPMGGPDGGNGGRGGDVIFEASIQMSTLQDFRYKRKFEAENGRPGEGGNCSGKDGGNVKIRVPVGTIITNAETKELIRDFTQDKEEWTYLTGGRGGKGNTHFASATYQAPKFSQPGEEGQLTELRLELKLLADVAIIGFPNSGKSTLISSISAAKPKIADYAFTTLTPNLGVVTLPGDENNNNNIVVADIPGLIPGAHKGAGLGFRFLKHIERTRAFVHLIDPTPLLDALTDPFNTAEDENKIETDSPLVNAAIDDLLNRYIQIRTELKLFNEALLHKPEIVVFSKVDLFGESFVPLLEKAQKHIREHLNSIRGFPPINGEPFWISAAIRKNLDQLKQTMQNFLPPRES